MNYAKWSTREELIKKLEAVNLETGVKKSGTPIMYDDKYLYIDSDLSHNLVVGSTGSGKTQSISLPMVKLSMMAGESLIINDPAGELYSKTAQKFEDEGYNVLLLNFDNPKLGNSFNPFKFPYNLYKNNEKDRAMELIEAIGYYLFGDTTANADPFWTNTTIDYFTGLVLYLFKNAKEEEINFLSINKLSNDINNKIGATQFMKSIKDDSIITSCLSGTLDAPAETRGSILSVFNQKSRAYVTRETLSNMLCNSDFDITKICNEKTVIYIVSKLSDYASGFISLFISQTIESISLYGNKDKNFNIIIDDFDEIVPIKNFARTLNYCRSMKVRITAIIRSYALLNKMYGKEEAEMLKVCFSNIIYLLSDDIYTLKDISESCGNTLINGKVHPLITIEELKTLNPFEAIVLKTRMMPIKTELLPDYRIDWGYKTVSKEMPVRKENTVSIFNLKEE